MPERSHRNRVAILAGLSLVLAVVTTSLPVDAAGGCHPDRPDDFPLNHWAGWRVQAHAPIAGVSARIGSVPVRVDRRHPGEFAYAWVMLTTEHPLGADAPYVQIGWAAFSGGGRFLMEQWKVAGQPPVTRLIGPAPAIGSVTQFGVTLEGGQFSFLIDGVAQRGDSLPSWFTPTVAENYAETLSMASQMPGTAAAPEVFRDARYLRGGWWHGFAGMAEIHVIDLRGRDDTAFFKAIPGSAGSLLLWDRACTR